jgi:TrmH family RNA methyltransferase
MTPMRREPERIIGSPRNQAVRTARALERDRAERQRLGLYTAWGLHLAQEALAGGAQLRQALIGPRLEESAEGRALLSRLHRDGVPIARATTRVLDGIAAGCGDQGILLLVALPTPDLDSILRRRPTLLVAAHGVQDPGNLGSIARTARGFGAAALLALEGSADPFGGRAVRAAMGAQFSLPIVVGVAATEAAAALRSAGLRLVAADPAGAELPIAIDLTRPTALLVGNEGAGLPDALLRAADHRVRIPMSGGVSSLNVHAAAAALLYETRRQRGFRPD